MSSSFGFVVEENALSGAIEIIVLSTSYGPQKRDKPQQAESDRSRDEVQ